jgi:hypothetical protein
MDDAAGGLKMNKDGKGPVNPLLVGGTALFVCGAMLALQQLGVLDWPLIWHYCVFLLVVLG